MGYINLVVLFCVLSSFALRARCSEQKLLNLMGDSVLNNLEMFDQSAVPIHDFKRNYPFGVATVDAKLGCLSDFKSIKRVGDVKLDAVNENQMLINFQVSFGNLKLRFEDYKVTSFGQEISSGIFEAVAKDNLVEFEVDMGQNSKCFLTIKRLDVLKVGDFQLRFFQPGGAENIIENLLANPAAKYFEESTKSAAESILRDELPTLIMPRRTVSTTGCLEVFSQTVSCKGTFVYEDCKKLTKKKKNNNKTKRTPSKSKKQETKAKSPTPKEG